MIRSIFSGTGSRAALLRAEMDRSSADLRRSADRIANLSTPGAFDAALSETDRAAMIEDEMVLVADRQIRFDAATKFLRTTYNQVRTAIRIHG